MNSLVYFEDEAGAVVDHYMKKNDINFCKFKNLASEEYISKAYEKTHQRIDD